MGCQGGHESYSHHRGTNEGNSGSSFGPDGPPRPPPSSMATYGSLASTTSSQHKYGGAMPPPSQVKRQPEEQNTGDKKVRYSFSWSIESTVCVSVSNPLRRDLNEKFFINLSC